MMPNWIVQVEIEWPAAAMEHPETAFNRLRPALEALRRTLYVLGGGEPHWHRLTVPRLEGETDQQVGELMAEQRQDTLDPVADELSKGPMPPR